MDSIENATPTEFTGPEDAIAWGHESGAFKDAVHSQAAYEKLKREHKTQVGKRDVFVVDRGN